MYCTFPGVRTSRQPYAVEKWNASGRPYPVSAWDLGDCEIIRRDRPSYDARQQTLCQREGPGGPGSQ